VGGGGVSLPSLRMRKQPCTFVCVFVRIEVSYVCICATISVLCVYLIAMVLCACDMLLTPAHIIFYSSTYDMVHSGVTWRIHVVHAFVPPRQVSGITLNHPWEVTFWCVWLHSFACAAWSDACMQQINIQRCNPITTFEAAVAILRASSTNCMCGVNGMCVAYQSLLAQFRDIYWSICLFIYLCFFQSTNKHRSVSTCVDRFVSTHMCIYLKTIYVNVYIHEHTRAFQVFLLHRRNGVPQEREHARNFVLSRVHVHLQFVCAVSQ